MVINHIDIVNFKNIAEASLSFCSGVNCLTGMNGMGKSNLLEAIHFLSMARGMSSIPESMLIRRDEEMMIVKGAYTMDAGDSQTISCGITARKGKTLKCNGKEYPRISNHIGKFPIVSLTPADTRIADGPAEERRRLTDMVISQAQSTYLPSLIRYNKALESRNKMLRAGIHDSILFESVESAMQQASEEVHSARKLWVEEIKPHFNRYYSLISGDVEFVELDYKSSLNSSDLISLLNDARNKDYALGYTSVGLHRDDIDMKLNGRSLRRFASQGQLKTYTTALRLAIFEYLHQHSGIKPLLLLDDVFDRLDAKRVESLMHTVTENPTFGQIFITDTNRSHIDSIIHSLHSPSLIFNVENGTFLKDR